MSDQETIVNPKSEKPASATKPAKVAKPRGRKGDKVITAFKNVPTDKVKLADFANQHGVSQHVLRQAKRFDDSGITGKVHCKKDKETGELMIWRDTATTATTTTATTTTTKK